MELSSLLNRTAPLEIDYCGEKVNVVVYTDRMTPKRRIELANLTVVDNEEQKDEQVLILAEVIKSWDVVLNGADFPPTYDNIAQLPYPLLAHITREVSSFLQERANPTQPNN